MSIRSYFRLALHTQMLPLLESGEETLVGGQAVMEGVMMRAPHSYCIAVRKSSGEIITREHPLAKVSERYPVFRFPVLRGLGTLGQAMSLGIKALRFSANAALEESAQRREEIPPGQLQLLVIVARLKVKGGQFRPSDRISQARFLRLHQHNRTIDDPVDKKPQHIRIRLARSAQLQKENARQQAGARGPSAYG